MKSENRIPKISVHDSAFPDPYLASKEGLVAWSEKLSINLVIKAYSQGIFPWYNEDQPVLWWSPDPRVILYPDDIKISKSLRQSMKKYHTRIDCNFLKVINLCRQVRIDKQEETWISNDIIKIYSDLFKEGIAHSIEVYDNNDNLVGGLYGLWFGRVFCGESMFNTKKDASKTALVHLCELLKGRKNSFIDCQVPNDFLISMGAKLVKRKFFLELLKNAK